MMAAAYAVSGALFVAVIVVSFVLGVMEGQARERSRLQAEYDRNDDLFRELSWRLYDVRIRERAIKKKRKEAVTE